MEARRQVNTGLNDHVIPLVAALKRRAAALRVEVSAGRCGETVIDAGLATPGSIAAGIAVAEIAMGGLSEVSLCPGTSIGAWPTVSVRSSQPVLSCLGSQLAGWRLADEPSGFAALGSGPARALAAREDIYATMGWRDTAAVGTLVLECEREPPPATVEVIAEACGLHPAQLVLVLAPTTSLAGAVQVAARCLEAALGKAWHSGFPLANIVDGIATSPLAPPHPDRLVSMGRTNDAILYGGSAHLFVTGPADAARDLAAHLPSNVSDQHGMPFAEILAAAGGDFYAVDPLLFGPAAVRVTALATGATFAAGVARLELVERAFNS